MLCRTCWLGKPKMGSRFIWVLVCAICMGVNAYGFEDTNPVAAPNHPQNVLKALEDFDTVYRSGFTVSGTRAGTDQMRRGRLNLRVVRRWKLAYGGDRVGYIMEIVDYEAPKFPRTKIVQLDPARGATADKQPEESPASQYSVTLRTRQWGYWGHDVAGNHYEDTVLAVDSTDKSRESGKMHNSSLFGPSDDGPIAPKREFLWSLGRFFSQQIDQITSVENTPDGYVLVEALGRKGNQQKGRWKLRIEPKAAWMVRNASFFWDRKPDSVNVEMKNEGTVWSGAYCIPAKAEINHWGALGNVETKHFTFDPAVEPFDERLYAETRQVVAQNQTPTLALHDFRVSPPKITEPNRRTSEQNALEYPDAGQNPSPWRWWIVIINAVVLAGFAAFLAWQRLAKRQREAGK